MLTAFMFIGFCFVTGAYFYCWSSKWKLWKKFTTLSETVKQLSNIIESQQEYVEHLKKVDAIRIAYIHDIQAINQTLHNEKELTQAKIDELMELIPPSDNTSAAVVMFRKVDDVIKVVEKLAPNSELARELKEILK